MPLGEGDVLVAEDVVFGDCDEGVGQTGHIGGAARCAVGVHVVGAGTLAQDCLLGVCVLLSVVDTEVDDFVAGGGVVAVVEHRVVQRQQARAPVAAVSDHEGGGGGRRAATAGAGEPGPRGVDAVLGCVVEEVGVGEVAVLGSAGCLRFWSESVVDHGQQAADLQRDVGEVGGMLSVSILTRGSGSGTGSRAPAASAWARTAGMSEQSIRAPFGPLGMASSAAASSESRSYAMVVVLVRGSEQGRPAAARSDAGGRLSKWKKLLRPMVRGGGGASEGIGRPIRDGRRMGARFCSGAQNALPESNYGYARRVVQPDADCYGHGKGVGALHFRKELLAGARNLTRAATALGGTALMVTAVVAATASPAGAAASGTIKVCARGSCTSGGPAPDFVVNSPGGST